MPIKQLEEREKERDTELQDDHQIKATTNSLFPLSIKTIKQLI